MCLGKRAGFCLFFCSSWFGNMRSPGQLVGLEQDLREERPWETHGKVDTKPGVCGFGLSPGKAVSLETHPLWLWGYLFQYNLCFLNLWRWEHILEWRKIRCLGKPSSHPFSGPSELSSVWEEMVWKTSKVMMFQLALKAPLENPGTGIILACGQESTGQFWRRLCNPCGRSGHHLLQEMRLGWRAGESDSRGLTWRPSSHVEFLLKEFPEGFFEQGKHYDHYVWVLLRYFW